MSSQQGFAMGVDLGTSNTVAVVRWPDGRTRPLLVDGTPVMPSGVYLDEHGRLHVGRDAGRLAQIEPARFEPNPKRRIDEPAVLLGDRELETAQLLAAVLDAVARAAVESIGFLPPAVLTYPAAWGPHRREALLAAAVRAGWPPPGLLPEPVGAARYFADVLRRPVPVGSSLGVFDFGGGTLDVAVVRNEGGRFAVLGSGGLPDLGGLDIDAALVDHLGRGIAARRPDVWWALSTPDTTDRRRNRKLFWDDVRAAKEMLSRAPTAPVTVPGLDSAVHLTREELEAVAAPLLRRAVQETASVIRRCGLRPDVLAGLFLVGGSSRLPLAARLLHADLGIAPTVLEQPELPVAEGALAELVRELSGAAGVPGATGVVPAGLMAPAGPLAPAGGLAPAGPLAPGSLAPGPIAPAGGVALAPTGAPGTPRPTGEVPVSGSPYSTVPGSTVPAMGVAPVSVVPGSAMPVSAAPVSGGQPPQAPLAPPTAPPTAPPGGPGTPPGRPGRSGPFDPAGQFGRPGSSGPGSSGPGPGGPGPGGPGGPALGGPGPGGPALADHRRFRRRGLVAIAAVTVFVLLVAGLVYWLRRDTPVSFTALESTDFSVPFGEGTVGTTSSHTLGDRAYVAWEIDTSMSIAAIDLTKPKKLWQVVAPDGSDDWEGIIATPRAILVIASRSSRSEARPIYALDPATGKLLWQIATHGGDSRYFFDSALVIESGYDDAVRAYDWSTGDQKWFVDKHRDSSGRAVTTSIHAAPALDDPATAGPAWFYGWAYGVLRGRDSRIVMLDNEDTLSVVDVDTGHVRDRKDVASYDDPYFAIGDKLYTVVNGQLREYDLTSLGEPRVVYTQTDGTRKPFAPQRCGSDQICVLERAGGDGKTTAVVAVNVKDRKEAWRHPAPNADGLVAVGEGVLATATGTTTTSGYFTRGGKQLLRTDDRSAVAVRLDPLSVLLFGRPPSTSTETVALTGVTADGTRKPLGSLPEVRSQSCSWNTHHLTCAGKSEFRVWRFAS